MRLCETGRAPHSLIGSSFQRKLESSVFQATDRQNFGEMAEWFKAAVLTRRQEAEANIDEVDGPEGVEGRMPGIKLP